MTNERVFQMAFSSVYPLLVKKAERKGRSKSEVDAVICWLTGYEIFGLQAQIDKDIDYETFFLEAPKMNPNAVKITGVICGHRVEEQKIRWLDKLVDELAKGKSLEKIFRN